MTIYKVLRPVPSYDCWGRWETNYEEYKTFVSQEKAEELRKQINGEIEIVETED